MKSNSMNITLTFQNQLLLTVIQFQRPVRFMHLQITVIIIMTIIKIIVIIDIINNSIY